MCAQLLQSWIIQLMLLLNSTYHLAQWQRVFYVIFHQITLTNIHPTYMSQLEVFVTVQL